MVRLNRLNRLVGWLVGWMDGWTMDWMDGCLDGVIAICQINWNGPPNQLVESGQFG